MHPIDHYPTIQRGLDELRRQAEQERIIRAAKLRKQMNSRLVRRFVNWVGTHLVRWGQKLGHFGPSRKTLDSFPASPHH